MPPITDKMVLIKVSKFVEILTKECQCQVEDISAEEFLAMACASWRIDTHKANQYPYAAAVYKNKIYAVFDVKRWVGYEKINHKHPNDNRSRFVGSTNEKLTKKYYRENVADLYGKKGSRKTIAFKE